MKSTPPSHVWILVTYHGGKTWARAKIEKPDRAYLIEHYAGEIGLIEPLEPESFTETGPDTWTMFFRTNAFGNDDKIVIERVPLFA